MEEKPEIKNEIPTEPKKSFLPPIFPKPYEITKKFNEQSQKSLILNSMFTPFSQLQSSDPSLANFSQNELRQEYTKYLSTPPDIQKTDLSNLDYEFGIDEDFILLTYLNMNKNSEISFPDFISEWMYLFKPCRSIETLSNRLKELQNWPSEQIDHFYELYTDFILNEKLFAESTHAKSDQAMLYTHSRCSYEPTSKIKAIQELDSTIQSLEPIIPMAMQDQKYSNCLAVLRSENYEFFMRNEAIMIGRGSADQIVDVELNFVSEKPCIHISRNQAIISFLEDCNFYIENCGNRVFRVNGVIIPIGGIALLPPNALLDFSDALLIFIPNLKMVNGIKDNLKKGPQTPNKQKKKADF